MQKIVTNKVLCFDREVRNDFFISVQAHCILCKKFLPVTHDKDKENNKRQNAADIEPGPLWKFRAFSGVSFFDEVFPSPSAFARTEEQI